MRDAVPEALERGRVVTGKFASRPSDRFYGCFYVWTRGVQLKIIAAEGEDPIAEGWEHVSVTVATAHRTPNWAEMCYVKNLFWGEDECVVQFHPPRSEYVNQHPNCLHLWKDTKQPFATPPSVLVGVKDKDNPTLDEREAIERWK